MSKLFSSHKRFIGLGLMSTLVIALAVLGTLWGFNQRASAAPDVTLVHVEPSGADYTGNPYCPDTDWTGGKNEPVVNAWCAVTRFDNGVTGVIKGNYHTGGRVHKFEIHGPGVSAYINLGFGPAGADATILPHKGKAQYSLPARGEGGEEIVRIDGKELAGGGGFHKYYGFWQEDRHFIDCVRSGRQPETNIHDAVESFRWVEQIAASGI